MWRVMGDARGRWEAKSSGGEWWIMKKIRIDARRRWRLMHRDDEYRYQLRSRKKWRYFVGSVGGVKKKV